MEIEPYAAKDLAERSRGTPRVANHLLRFVRDFVQIQGKSTIDRKAVNDALHLLCIDHLGLDEMDKKILSLMIDHYNGGPVGLSTLATSISEEPATLAGVYEPYLIMQGLIKLTPRGREATELAYQHLGRTRRTT